MDANTIARNVIINNYYEKHSTTLLKKDLAARMNMSVSYIAKLFREDKDVTIDFDLIEAYCKATNENVITLIGKILEKLMQQ